MQSQTDASVGCVPPPYIFLVFTVLMTVTATACLCTAIMTDHWENIYWDRQTLEQITNNSNHLVWYLNYRVARLDLLSTDRYGYKRNVSIFLVPMIGGVWSLCIDLSEKEMRHLGPFRHSKVAPCVNYLVNNAEAVNNAQQDAFHNNGESVLGPHLRMQNLSISCALVCLIIMGTASLVGAFGICQKQISAILITGVMYLLAALFALFTSMILLFKRQHGRTPTDFDGVLSSKDPVVFFTSAIFAARVFRGDWSLDLGWCGVILCTITSICWILLSKIMRFSPTALLL